MNKKLKELFIILLFFFLSAVFFRNYFIKNLVPFPSNLLVFYYEPWRSYSWENYPNGPPNKPIGFDNLRIFYPLRNLTINQIKDLEIPLWNPYAFSGNTLLATYQSAVFHPFGFLFLLFPQIEAWSLIIVFQPFLTLIFTYLFLKELNLSKKSAVFGAIIFAFSGFMIVLWEESFMAVYSAMFLPLILYGIKRLNNKISLFNFLTVVAGLTFSLLSGWFQMTFYAWTFALLWAIFLFFSQGKKKNFLTYILISYLLSLLISGIHLIPSIEAYLASARGTTDAKYLFDIYLQPLQNVVTFIAPDYFGNPGSYNYINGKGFFYEKVFFIGIPGLIFGVYSFFSNRKNENIEKFFKLLFVFTFSLGFYLPTSWLLLYHLNLPFISKIIPTRIFFLSVFCLSVLSAYGMESYFKEMKFKIIKIISLVIGVLILLMFSYGIYYMFVNPNLEFKAVLTKNTILPSVILFLTFLSLYFSFKFSKYKNKIYYVIVLISIFSSAYFANKYLYFSERKFVFPEVPVLTQLKKISSINRFWGINKGNIESNFATYYRLYSPEGYDSIYIRRYGELINAAEHEGKFTKQIPRADAKISYDSELTTNFKNKYRRKILSLLGTRYIINNASKNEETDLVKPIWSDDKYTLYEYKKALPRIYLVNNYLVEKNEQKILDIIFDDKFDLNKLVVLEEKPKEEIPFSDFNGQVKMLIYKPNKIAINTRVNSNSLLFISDNYYSGWKAYIDGKETKIYRANYTFRSVIAPKGNHEIIFKYEPESLFYGIIATLVGLLISLVVSIIIIHKEKKL